MGLQTMQGNVTIQQFVGQTFGGYKLLQLVGVGGMGAVYRAKQLSPDREVAVKVMSPELLRTPTFAHRFAQEAKIASSLDHIHIVPVYDYGIENSISYVVYPQKTPCNHELRRKQPQPTGRIEGVP